MLSRLVTAMTALGTTTDVRRCRWPRAGWTRHDTREDPVGGDEWVLARREDLVRRCLRRPDTRPERRLAGDLCRSQRPRGRADGFRQDTGGVLVGARPA